MAAQSFDVVIVGGGPAGIAAALALVESGASVLVVERSLYDQPRVGETFPPGIFPILSRLGLWEDFREAGSVESTGIRSFWGSAAPYEQSFIFTPYGTGWHVDRRAFDASLASAAQRRGVQLARGSRVLAYERSKDEGWMLRVASVESELDARASFVVDATGRAATLARRLGATRASFDQLIGVFGFFKPARGDARLEPFTLIEAAQSGWWYSAPLPGGGLVAALMTDADLYAHNASLWRTQLELAPHTQERTASYILDGRLRVVGASSSRLVPAFGQGWLAVGDAAAAYDPLSGDGVYRALVAGIHAATVLSGDEAAFVRYGEKVEAEFSEYLQARRMYYSRESRWPESLFWERRRNNNGHPGDDRQSEIENVPERENRGHSQSNN